ncbi:MAG: efflux RND transporter periplasmic adaptor subunit [Flavobacteriaceae bacterium]|nr:efflux RND transporter periplasmic adaptor subunit [Flavobacteriaceae bacterium]
MKKTLTFIISAFIISCGSEKNAEKTTKEVLASNNLEEIIAKKEALEITQQQLSVEIKQLNDKISVLDTSKKRPLITTVIVENKEFNHYLELQGNVVTKQNMLLYPEMAGQLVKIYVKEGQRVAKGQVLALIDDGGMSNQLAQLEAQASLAKTTYERQQRLWKQKIGSEMQFLQAKTNYEATKNSVTRLQKALDKYKVKAPFSGTIDAVMKEQGALVAQGQGSEIFRIINLGNMYIKTDVPESYITTIKRGKKVEVEFPVLGQKLTSKVRQTSNYINPTNRTFSIEVGLPNKRGMIKPNLTAKLKINDYTNKKAILVPQHILSENANGEQYVYIVENIKNNIGKAKQIIVKTGKSQGDFIEILQGISKGMYLIDEGARTVKNGQEVQIISEQ